MSGLTILALVFVLYALLAGRLDRLSITAPMVFVVVGGILGPGGTGLLRVSFSNETALAITEITLALLLFADASTGARSPAMVRQGQIGEIISAKPQARRLILEEAAGVSGLHSRRHEAELRQRGRVGEFHQRHIALARPDDRRPRLDQRQRERQYKRVVTQFCDHDDDSRLISRFA